MNWHPLICGPESVRAYQAGKKSQTRRVMKPQPECFEGVWYWKGHFFDWQAFNAGNSPFIGEHCPHGRPGDGLYSVETLTAGRGTCEADWGLWHEDGTRVSDRRTGQLALPPEWWFETWHERERWKIPSRLLRGRSEWARIFRELTDVRVERVQDISLADVNREGIGHTTFIDEWNARHHFAERWNSLNAKRGHGWDTDPWVRVLATEETEERP